MSKTKRKVFQMRQSRKSRQAFADLEWLYRKFAQSRSRSEIVSEAIERLAAQERV